ncbi:uncharacterized protein LOC126658233 [Mercurialis annua]|uniref:uncharacterized protein LOC126658233 n=1 Tax=Mercurialis annua TaxID=3986 RepID=UPI00215EE540|nr:uncharacterized protein LOC126658233 [Mercurialis annua]
MISAPHLKFHLKEINQTKTIMRLLFRHHQNHQNAVEIAASSSSESSECRRDCYFVIVGIIGTPSMKFCFRYAAISSCVDLDDDDTVEQRDVNPRRQSTRNIQVTVSSVQLIFGQVHGGDDEFQAFKEGN